MKNLLSGVFIVAAIAALGPKADAQMIEGEFKPANLFIEGSLQDYQNSLRLETGFRISGEHLQSNFYVAPLVKKIFTENAKLRQTMPQEMPAVFAPIVNELTEYIDKIGKANGNNNELKNGITNRNLAIKITRLAFCFGTDPYGITAQIKKESTFNRTLVSSTGAVGFTQMTGIAIDEVHDQLGNRGIQGTRMENVPYLRTAADCYLGSGRRFVPMFELRVILKGHKVSGDATNLRRTKRFLRSHIDSDLVYGQITLKVQLARARAAGFRDGSAYSSAFKNYNGEPRGGARRYATEVLRSMNSI